MTEAIILMAEIIFSRAGSIVRGAVKIIFGIHLTDPEPKKIYFGDRIDGVGGKIIIFEGGLQTKSTHFYWKNVLW